MKIKINTITIILLVTAAAFAQPLANENSDGLYVRSIQQVMRLEPDEIDIGTAALIVAEEWSQLVHGRKYQQELDDMALEIRGRIKEKGLTGSYKSVFVINDYLYNELKFKTVKEATDPNDLFMHSVIDNRRGYCLSLSILYLALGERLGLPLCGVVVPGHFFVRYDNGTIRFNIETTSGGANPDDEHYLEKFPFSDINGNALYMKNLNKLQTLGCLFNNFGTVYLGIGDYDSAQKALEKAVKINPSLAESHLNLGNVYLHNNRTDKAIYQYRRAIELTPSNASAYHNIGNAYRQKKWYNDAISSYEKALKLDPNNVDTYLSLASVYIQIDMLPNAEYLLKQAKLLAPSRTEIYLMKGDILVNRRQFKKAIDQYETAVYIDDKNALAYFNMALCYGELGLVESQINSYGNAIKNKPDMFAAYVNLGNIYHNIADYEKSLQYYKTAEQLKPDDAQLCFAIGGTYLTMKNYPQAVVYYHKAVKLNPQMPEAHYNLGISYYNMKNYQKAYEHILKAQQLGFDVNDKQLKTLERKLR